MNLKTEYLGLTLRHPIVPSASPLTGNLDQLKRMEDLGAGAVVLPSLFEEQLSHESRQLDHYLAYGSESHAEALNYFPEMERYEVGPERYLDHIRKAKQALEIPVIASLNGVSSGGWISFARELQAAGADALELNIYYIPTDIAMTGRSVEQMYVETVRDVDRSVDLPVAVKLSPFFSAPAHMAMMLFHAGADGLVLFNRFYQPDFNLDTLEVEPHLMLSTPFEMRLPLRWVAILFDKLPLDFAITSGVHTHFDVLKGLMAGANVIMMASELLRNGVDRIGEINAEMAAWMQEHEYESVAQMRGSMSAKNISDSAAFERANYMKVLQSWRNDPTGQLL